MCGDKIMGYYKLLPKLKSWEIEEYKDKFDSPLGTLLKMCFAIFLFGFLLVILSFQAADFAMKYIDNPDMLLEKIVWMLDFANIGITIFMILFAFTALIILYREYKWIKEKEKKYKMCG